MRCHSPPTTKFPQRDRPQQQGHSDEQSHGGRATLRREQREYGERRQQDQCVLAGQDQGARHRTERDPTTERLSQPKLSYEKEQSADEKGIERRLLDEAVEEDRRRIDRQSDARREPYPLREEAQAGARQEPAARRAERTLHELDGRRAVAEEGLDPSQEVGIERRLIEDPVAEPVARRELARPECVALGIAHEHREEGRVPQQEEVQEPKREGQAEDGQAGGAQPLFGSALRQHHAPAAPAPIAHRRWPHS